LRRRFPHERGAPRSATCGPPVPRGDVAPRPADRRPVRGGHRPGRQPTPVRGDRTAKSVPGAASRQARLVALPPALRRRSPRPSGDDRAGAGECDPPPRQPVVPPGGHRRPGDRPCPRRHRLRRGGRGGRGVRGRAVPPQRERHPGAGLSRFPPAVVHARPRLLLARARLALQRGDPSAATPWLDRADAALSGAGAGSDGYTPSVGPALSITANPRAALALNRAIATEFSGDHRRTLALLDTAVSLARDGEVTLVAIARGHMGRAEWQAGHLDAAERHLLE